MDKPCLVKFMHVYCAWYPRLAGVACLQERRSEMKFAMQCRTRERVDGQLTIRE